MADNFINIIDGAERLFFINNLSPNASFLKMKRIVMDVYDSNPRQIQVKGKLDLIRLIRLISEEEISAYTKGLTKLVQIIEQLAPKCHTDFRTDSHKNQWLRRAMSDFPELAMAPIQSIMTNRLSFNGLVTSLHESIQTTL